MSQTSNVMNPESRPPADDVSFNDLALSEKVLSAVAAAGYEKPTPIQAGAIPVVLQRRDVLGIAQTGTGKTASFTLPMLTLLEKGRARARMPRSLILEPTRELAAQVEQSFETYGAQHKLTVALLIGGVSFGEQDRKLDRGADVLIATPGRLLDHFERGKLMLNGVETLVVDEADRMLDMGFIPDIERIFKLTPMTRQTLFFSATMPAEIQRLTKTFLHDPVRIAVAPPSTVVDTIDQKFVSVPGTPKEKRAALRRLIGECDVENAIIFCNRKRDVVTVAASLKKHGFNAGELHGDLNQHKRIETLDAFRDGSLPLLVASDVAARGLDIPDVGHVLNFDVPIAADDYVHRIGRTGRAGRKGNSVTLVAPSDKRALEAIEKLLGAKADWLGAPAVTGKAPAGNKPPRQRGRRTEGKPGNKTPAKQQASKPENSAPRETKSAKSEPAARKPREEATAKPAKRSEPVKGLGDHVPAFMKRPLRSG